jgi:glycosyltransferase involved in cell wall biosynthesis
VGSLPENPGALPDFVRPLGFIDKATAEGRQRLDALFAESHFLIVPSRAEAFGIVFCEASSFAVPSLASQSGGIPSVVRDNYNGRTFPLDAPPGHFVQYVLGLMGDYSQYQQLARRAFAEYTTRLNWHTAAQTVNSLLSILNTL